MARKDNENPEIFAVSQSKWGRSGGRRQQRRLTWEDMGSFSQPTASISTSKPTMKTKTNTVNAPYFVVPPGLVDSFGGSGDNMDDEGGGGGGGFDDDQNQSSNNNDNIDNPSSGGRSFSSSSFSSWMVPTTAEDKAILKNLTDICHATTRQKRHGGSSGDSTVVSGVNLLESCGGLILPTKHVASEILKLSSPVFPLVPMDDDGTNGSDNNDGDDDDDNDEVAAEDFFGAAAAAGGRGDDDEDDDEIDAAEIFDIIRNIQDPEHPHTLEELGVVSLEQVELLTTDVGEDEMTTANTTTATTTTTNQNKNKNRQKLVTVSVRFTPTIPHCSMATLIGLCLRVKLLRSLPSRKFQILVQIEPGTHASENAINKQLRDKERVCAALENKHLNGVVNKCIKNE